MTTLRSRYPGLRPFDSEEQQYFFGRDEEIESVCRLLDLDNLTILHGPSGMGKSSLINAGILPALSEVRNWDIPYHMWSRSDLATTTRNLLESEEKNMGLKPFRFGA